MTTDLTFLGFPIQLDESMPRYALDLVNPNGQRIRVTLESAERPTRGFTPSEGSQATGSATPSSSDLLAALTGMREAHDALRSALKKIPAKGVNRTYFASRYDTDDEHVLHVWGLGVDCFDLRIPKAELSAALDGCPVLLEEQEHDELTRSGESMTTPPSVSTRPPTEKG